MERVSIDKQIEKLKQDIREKLTLIQKGEEVNRDELLLMLQLLKVSEEIEAIDDDEYLSLLRTLELKVRYLRCVKGYSQNKVAKILDRTKRHIQRYESTPPKVKRHRGSGNSG